MEDQNTKIANLQVFISEKCSEREKEIINYYWEFKENENFRYPKQVANTFGIGLTELRKLLEPIANYPSIFFASIVAVMNCKQLIVLPGILKLQK